MPEDYVGILAKVVIPEIHFTLYREGKSTSEASPIMELVIEEIKTKVQLGQDF
jgi:hypothetical protein